MKKLIVLSLSLALLITAFVACGGKPGLPKAGSAKAEDMLSLIPKTAEGLVVFDVHRIMNITLVDQSFKSGDDAAKYKDFVESTGLDPQKDIYFAALGITQAPGPDGKPGAQLAGVINLKYDQAKILAKMKLESPEFKEDTYEGVSIFTVPEKEKGTSMFGAFLDASNIAVGQEVGVKAVIDVFKGKSESVLKNSGLMDMTKSANKASLVWCVFPFSPEQVKQMTATSPMLKSLETLKALMMYVDDKNKGLQIEIKALSLDPAKNKELADMLTGFKAMGGMFAGENPEIGEVINGIEVTSGADHVKLFINMTEAQMAKLGELAKKQVKSKLDGMMPGEKKDEPIKEEIK